MSEESKSAPAGCLYVGNLHPDVTELILFEKFSQIGSLVSVKVCRNKENGKSLGYAYVNFYKLEDAERALQAFNFETVLNRPMRIMWFQRDPTIRKSAVANVFVKNLDEKIDDHSLHNIFSSFGNILSSKVATTEDNLSKGYGFVQFENEESANNAIQKLNGMLLNGKQISVLKFVPKDEREKSSKCTNFTNLYVKNFPDDVDDNKLVDMFREYGTIKSAKVMVEEDGTSKCFGFVNFENASEAKQAIAELNGKCIGGKILYVGRAQKKSEREELKKNKQQPFSEWATDRQLIVRNLEPDIDDRKLKQLFDRFGKVLNAVVMTNASGKSRNFGFVKYLEARDAQRAMAAMNGCLVDGKVIEVSFTLNKRENKSTESRRIDSQRGEIE